MKKIKSGHCSDRATDSILLWEKEPPWSGWSRFEDLCHQSDEVVDTYAKRILLNTMVRARHWQ